MPSFDSLRDEYHGLLATATVRERWAPIAEAKARRILANKSRYQEIERATGVPWDVIACIHCMEGDLNFGTHLANGDSLQRHTVNVPAGRIPGKSPPFTFKEAAIDALQLDGATKITDWSPEMKCYFFEKFNGWGYRMHHPDVKSAYLWSGTNHYTSGKYVSDGQWSQGAVSGQIGAIAVLKKIEELDISHEQVITSSRKLTFLSRLKKAIYTVGGGWFTADTLNIAPDFLSRIQGFMADHKLVMVIVGIALLVGVFKIIEVMTVQDAKDGRYTPSGMAEPVIEPDHEPHPKVGKDAPENVS
jgi:lysozyme family protein